MSTARRVAKAPERSLASSSGFETVVITMTDDSIKWMHFITDWEADSKWSPSEYRCKRCGEVAESTEACYDHRTGIVSPCTRKRFRRRVGRTLDRVRR